MALVLADRVRDTTTTTSTGTITLSGTAPTGFQNFSVIGNGNTTYYTIAHQTANEWEVGIGTYTSSGTTLARTTVLASSNAGSLVVFSSGTKDVFVTYPAERSVNLSSAALTSGRIPYATTDGLLTNSANLTFDGTTLTANTIGAFTLSGTVAGGGNQLNNVVIGTTTPLAGTFSSLTDSGNLTFTGTGNRIIGDFSNATVANRVAFQTSTTNGQTSIGVIPNGTSTAVQLQLFSAPDYTNYSRLAIQNTGTLVTFLSDFAGTGSYLPVTFNVGGSERARIDTIGNVGIGTSSPSSYGSPLSVYAATNPTLVIASGNANAYLRLYSTSDNNMYLTNTGGAMTVITANAERMRIDTSGYAQIGTTTADGQVHIKAAAGQGVPLTLTSTDAGGNPQVVVKGSRTYQIGTGNSGSGFAGQLFFYDGTAAATRMLIDSSGNVGIGTSSPSSYSKLAVLGSDGTGFTGITAINSNANVGIAGVQFSSDTTYVKAAIGLLRSGANGQGSIVFYNDSNTDAANWATTDEKMRIDSIGAVLINQSSSIASAFGEYPRFQVSQLRGVAPSIPAAFYCFGNDTVGARISLGKSRGTAIGTQTIVQNGDELGGIYFCGSDGTNMNQVAASITGISGGVPGATADMPGALLFNTTADGAGSPTERMRIDSSGNVLVTSAAGLGYGTGAGGSVTQATSKATAVTLNKPCGTIILAADALASNTTARFSFNNSILAITDTVILIIRNGVTAGAYLVWVDGTAAGSCTIAIRNISGGSLSDAVVLNFSIIKGVTA